MSEDFVEFRGWPEERCLEEDLGSATSSPASSFRVLNPNTLRTQDTLHYDYKPRWPSLASLPLPPSQPHSRPAAVFIDELDAGRLQGASDSQIIGACQCSLIFLQLGPANSGDAYGRRDGKVVRGPANERTRRSYLSAGQVKGRKRLVGLCSAHAMKNII
jgi:hypothetical protein